MGYFKQIILNFLSKSDFDFGRSDISLQNFHPQIYATLALQGVFFEKNVSIFRWIQIVATVAVLIVEIVLNTLNVYRGITTYDYFLTSECVCYDIIMCFMFFIYAGIIMNRDNIIKQVKEMEKDFKQFCNLETRHREQFLAYQLLIWKLFVCWTSFIIFMTVALMLSPGIIVLWQNLAGLEPEHRPFIFPVWLPNDDPFRTPNYEFLFIMEMWGLTAFNMSFCGYIYVLFHILIHYYLVLHIIILDFEVLFDGLEESVVFLPKQDPRRMAVQLTCRKRFERIVSWHVSVFRAIKTLSSVYQPSLVYQLSTSSIVICLLTFKIAQKLDENEIDFKAIVIVVAVLLQLWIPCYLGTILRNKGFAVGAACWECGWERSRLGRLVRTELTLVLLRAQQPINIKYAALPFVELETFSTVLSTAYTYFNMLRQSSK